MPDKFRFASYDEPADATVENLEKLNRLRSLYYAHLDSGRPVGAFAEEFFRAMGRILMGAPLEDLNLTHVEFERDWLGEDDDQIFVHVVLSFPPE